MPNPYNNKVQLADGTVLIDLSNDTLSSANQLAQGIVAHDRTGAVITGTATQGGSVTQDQDGFIVLPSEGGGSPSVGGLEYETGTFTPSEDIARPTINFTNTHTVPPAFIEMYDATQTYSDTYNSNYEFGYSDWYRVFGSGYLKEATDIYYGLVTGRYRGSSATGMTNANTSFNITSDAPDDSSSSYPRYYVSAEWFKPFRSTSSYWRAGRTYKWIAVWAPTS